LDGGGVRDDEIRTGMEVTDGERRGVVVDGHVCKSGPNKGRVEVMWIGGSWSVGERPADVEELTR
jgi:hypothetical protein